MSGFTILYILEHAVLVLVFVLYSFWIPQIFCTAYQDSKPPLTKYISIYLCVRNCREREKEGGERERERRGREREKEGGERERNIPSLGSREQGTGRRALLQHS